MNRISIAGAIAPEEQGGTDDLLALTTKIVAAHVSRNAITSADVPKMIREVHASLAEVAQGEVEEPAPTPAVPIRRSVQPDYLVCLEDGKKMKMLKRYLMTNYGMTPDEYRAKWGLPSDYPMVAPNYSKARSALAVRLGLGRRASEEAVEEVEETAQEEAVAKAAPKKRGRPRKSESTAKASKPRKKAAAAQEPVAQEEVAEEKEEQQNLDPFKEPLRPVDSLGDDDFDDQPETGSWNFNGADESEEKPAQAAAAEDQEVSEEEVDGELERVSEDFYA